MEEFQKEQAKPSEQRSLQREERARETISQIRKLLEAEVLEPARALFKELHPADQAEALKDLAQESRQELLAAVSPSETASVLEHLEPEEAVAVLQRLDAPALAEILDEAAPDVAVDVLKHLPEERSGQALQEMRRARTVESLLQYPEESAGGVMTLENPVVRDETTAGNALDLLRILGPQAENLGALFVVDSQGKLVGSLSVLRLALAQPRNLLRDLMDPEVTSVRVETDQEECARLMERYDLAQLPVVDQDSLLVGVIRGEDIVHVVEEEATEDMYKMIGIGGERLFGPLLGSLRHRLPWLFVNLGTVLLAAAVVSLFQSTIARVVVLAVFLPVVAGQGGIGGVQTLTLVVRSMALGEIHGSRGLRILLRELALGLTHGLLLGVAVALAAFVWQGSPILGVVLGVAMLGNMLVAGMAGAGIPLLLRRLHLDPAVASGVLVTTCTDIMGFLMFLGLATLLVNFLV